MGSPTEISEADHGPFRRFPVAVDVPDWEPKHLGIKEQEGERRFRATIIGIGWLVFVALILGWAAYQLATKPTPV